MKKVGFIAIVAALLVSGVAPPYAQAHEDTHEHSEAEHSRMTNDTISNTTSDREPTNTTSVQREEWRTKKQEALSRVQSHREQIQLKREKMIQELEARRTEKRTMLAEKRLELCEQRQTRINQLIDKSSATARERLAFIQSFESRVVEFYEREGLDSSEYEAAVTLVNEREATATAAIEVIEGTSFECSRVDGENPSREIKQMHATKVASLNEYRDSVKQLIRIVKAAYEQQSTAVEGSAS